MNLKKKIKANSRAKRTKTKFINPAKKNKNLKALNKNKVIMLLVEFVLIKSDRADSLFGVKDLIEFGVYTGVLSNDDNSWPSFKCDFIFEGSPRCEII
jgi:hypothetical protein